MLLPLLSEMPAGKLGVDLTCRAVQVVTLGEPAGAAPAVWLPTSATPAPCLPLPRVLRPTLALATTPPCHSTPTLPTPFDSIPPSGVAFTTYATVGFFAAARYGLSTAGDVLVNRWLPGRWDGLLDVLMAAYLAVR